MITIVRKSDGSHSVTGGELPAQESATKKPITVQVYEMADVFSVETLEGVMRGKVGDFLIVGVNGEMYPCDREIFFKSYDRG